MHGGELTSSGNDAGHAAPQAEDTLGRSDSVGALDNAIVDSSRVRVHDLHTGLDSIDGIHYGIVS